MIKKLSFDSVYFNHLRIQNKHDDDDDDNDDCDDDDDDDEDEDEDDNTTTNNRSIERTFSLKRNRKSSK